MKGTPPSVRSVVKGTPLRNTVMAILIKYIMIVILHVEDPITCMVNMISSILHFTSLLKSHDKTRISITVTGYLDLYLFFFFF